MHSMDALIEKAVGQDLSWEIWVFENRQDRSWPTKSRPPSPRYAYSRSLTKPGIGIEYVPSALATSGEGLSKVNLSMPGPNS